MSKLVLRLFLAAVASLSLTSRTSVNSQPACNTSTIGAELLDRDTSSTQQSDETFLVFDHRVDCDGVVTRWEYKLNPNALNYTPVAQIWRPSPVQTNPVEYLLVGEMELKDNKFDPGNPLPDMVTIDVQENQQIPVQSGDMIAWSDRYAVNQSERLFLYYEATNGSNLYGRVQILPRGQCPPVVGQSCPWQSASVWVRDYSLQATVETATRGPEFINLPAPADSVLLETVPVGTVVYEVRASNDFTWQPSLPPAIYYSLVDDNSTTACPGWFAINATTGIVTTSATLAYDSDPKLCQLTVSISQGSLTPVTETLNVSIQYVNLPHVITNLPNSTNVDCLLDAPDEVIFPVLISDRDYPLSSTPVSKTYRLLGVSPFNDFFDIDRSTGEIFIIKNLSNWIGPATFTLNVTVTDVVNTAGPEQLRVTLTNYRMAPQISNLPAVVDLLETETVNEVVYQVQARTNPPAPAKYRIVQARPSSGLTTFNIETNSGIVTLLTLLDVVNASSYVLSIQAEDGDDFMTSSIETLTINVGWVNERPQFTNNSYAYSIDEDQSPGIPLPGPPVGVTDRDQLYFGDWVTYFTDTSLFTVSNQTGRVYATTSLFLPIRTESVTYEVQVTAVDSHGGSDLSKLVVTVNDINNHSPVFNPTVYNGSVTQGGVGGSGTGVIVLATDNDAGLNAEIRYSITAVEAASYFEIDSVTGIVTQKQAIPNFPENGRISFLVTATDRGVPPLSGTATVNIDVTPSNEHAPIFSEDLFELELRSDASVGSKVFAFSPEDEDAASVNNFTFRSVYRQTDFSVGFQTGDVIVRNKLGAFKTFYVGVQVSDSGQGKEYFTSPVKLRVDTYKAADQLIDFTLERPLAEIQPKVNDFLLQLGVVAAPWIFKLEAIHYTGANTVLRAYALRPTSTTSSTLSATSQNADKPKQFVGRDDILGKLRTNIHGYPVEALRSPEFAEYQVSSVMPAYPVWLLDTPWGIATLTLICVIALALIIIITVVSVKCCLKRRRNKEAAESRKEEKEEKEDKVNEEAEEEPVVVAKSDEAVTKSQRPEDASGTDMFPLNYRTNSTVPPATNSQPTPPTRDLVYSPNYDHPPPPMRPDATIKV